MVSAETMRSSFWRRSSFLVSRASRPVWASLRLRLRSRNAISVLLLVGVVVLEEEKIDTMGEI